MAGKKKICAGCAKPASEEFAPFCSAGCKDRDLLKWLDGGHRVPGPPAAPEQIAEELAKEYRAGDDG